MIASSFVVTSLQLGAGAGEGAAAGQFRGQDRDALVLRQRHVVGVYPGPREQFRDNLLVYFGVLPQVQRR